MNFYKVNYLHKVMVHKYHIIKNNYFLHKAISKQNKKSQKLKLPNHNWLFKLRYLIYNLMEHLLKAPLTDTPKVIKWEPLLNKTIIYRLLIHSSLVQQNSSKQIVHQIEFKILIWNIFKWKQMCRKTRKTARLIKKASN